MPLLAFTAHRPHPSRNFVLRPATHLWRVTAAQHSSTDLPIATDAGREPQALLPSARPRCPWPEPMEETMRVLVTMTAVALHENRAGRSASPDCRRTPAEHPQGAGAAGVTVLN